MWNYSFYSDKNTVSINSRGVVTPFSSFIFSANLCPDSFCFFIGVGYSPVVVRKIKYNSYSFWGYFVAVLDEKVGKCIIRAPSVGCLETIFFIVISTACKR